MKLNENLRFILVLILQAFLVCLSLSVKLAKNIFIFFPPVCWNVS